jgi:hypothetical protein
VLAALLIAALCTAALCYFSATRQRLHAGRAALVCAVAGGAIVLTLAPVLLNQTKDMGPFVHWIGQQLPPGERVYATGVDETLAAEFPFYTGRPVVALSVEQLRGPVAISGQPAWVVVQDNHDGRAADLEPDYTLIGERSFGAHRSLRLWRLRSAGTVP